MSSWVDQFAEYHGFSMPQWWQHGESLVTAVLESKNSVDKDFGNVDDFILNSEPSLGVLFHMCGRVYEHVAAAMVCFATSNGASAEILARVAMEASVNVRYILIQDRNSMFLAWLRSYLQEDERQVEKWVKEAEHSNAGDIEIHIDRIASRRKVKLLRSQFVKVLEHEFREYSTIDDSLKFAKNISDRFTAVGEQFAYRVAYARLSSQTHMDAEDTINYMVAKLSGNQRQMEQMGLETVAFSDYMIHLGSHFYLKMLKEFVTTFDLLESAQVIESSERQIVDQMSDIGDQWNW